MLLTLIDEESPGFWIIALAIDMRFEYYGNVELQAPFHIRVAGEEKETDVQREDSFIFCLGNSIA